MKTAKFVALLLIACIGITGFAYLTGNQRYGLVSSGWEIYNQVAAIEYSDKVYSKSSQFTSPRELKGVYWKVDVDDPQSGVATLLIEVSEIRHVDFTGKDTPNDKPADTMNKQIGDNMYYMDYHIYMYTVTVRTVADKTFYNGGGFFVKQWKHETSFPYEGWNGILGGVGTEHIGKKFQGGVYTKFVIDPWQGGTYHDAPNGYVLKNCWAGVMNTYVFKKQAGQVANQWGETPQPDQQGQMWFKAGIDEGNQVPMYADDGTFGTPASSVRWDSTVSPSTRIQSSVVHYLPAELQAGMHLTTDVLGVCQEMSPCDVYVQYTLRVDVLQVHNFALATAVNPPTPQPPTDFFSWAKGFWEGLGSIFSNPLSWLFILLIVALVVLLLLALFAPGVLTAILWYFGKDKKK